jgi:hypothetical protein
MSRSSCCPRPFRTQRPDATDLGHAGLLERSWNAHPAGSLVLRVSTGSSVFVVVDLPPSG